MAYFYRNGLLNVGEKGRHEVDIASLARKSGRPLYVYDLDNIRARFQVLNEAFAGVPHTVHYAMKANSHPGILALFAKLGAGADTVSGGEIERAMAAGIPASRIIFSGVAKTGREIELALKSKIKQINVESLPELERIRDVAAKLGVTADVALRINPDVNPVTHPYITTGFRENKFGIDESALPQIVAILKGSPDRLRLRGLTMHIGSQLFDLAVMAEAIEKTIAVHKRLTSEGFKLDRLDIGGGLGINYESPDETAELERLRAYGKLAVERVKPLGVELLTEPGRVLVARAGLLVGEVQYVKATPAKTFAILDTGMHHLIRPALYGAKHRVVPLEEKSVPAREYDLVGPICESSDFLAKSMMLPELSPGDFIGIADAGAYGFVMASRYNSHELPLEICVSEGLTVE